MSSMPPEERMKGSWADVIGILVATAILAGLMVMATRAALDEIHNHLDKIEVRIEQLEKDVEALEEREALEGIKCGGFDPDELEARQE